MKSECVHVCLRVESHRLNETDTVTFFLCFEKVVGDASDGGGECTEVGEEWFFGGRRRWRCTKKTARTRKHYVFVCCFMCVRKL